MDYAELVKELRGFSSWEIEPHKAIMKKSADAIEQLTAELEYTKRQYDLAVDDLEKIGWGEWIPATERLPEKTERCLVTRFDYVTNTPFLDLLWYEKGVWWNRHFTGDYAVTHWMPLPEPPKEGKNERL